MRHGLLFALAALLHPGPAAGADSSCYGSSARGRITGAVQLPTSGPNFSAYSRIGVALGRNYVHAKVRSVVLAAYAALEHAAPNKTFVYGETSSRTGGPFRPHKTHQNGLSVDFMVPVVNASGRSIPLPTGVFNKFGYGIEFDKTGHYQSYVIDFEALGEHVYQLDRAAKASGIGITRVIFDPQLQPLLFRTTRGAYLQTHLAFSPKPAWVRHDEHYHVDFDVACRPLKG
jgi:penicillin-insensitive murein endopeptidase